MVGCEPRGVMELFDILDLFADFFEFGFGIDDGLGDGGVVGFGADGVEFAEQFLAEEVERAARGIGGVEVLAELEKVGGETGDFLGDVAAVGEEGDLTEDAVVGGVEFEVGVAETFEKEVALADEAVRGGGGDAGGGGLEEGEAGE